MSLRLLGGLPMLEIVGSRHQHADVVNALAMTTERSVLNARGAEVPWCPPEVAEAVRRMVVARNYERPILRLVRLIKMASLCERGDFVRFIYIRVAAARSARFQIAFVKAQADGRMPQDKLRYEDDGVLLLSKEDGNWFQISFVQMPKLVALLDVLHNSLGYAVVSAILDPYLKDHPGADAKKAANTLSSAFNEWLAPRLESKHYRKMALAMTKLLSERAGRFDPAAMNDALILEFWNRHAHGAEALDGLRLWRNAAIVALRYARCLEESLRRNEEASQRTRLGTDTEHGEIDLASEDVDHIELLASPMCVLFQPPAGRVKWFTKEERKRLLNYLAGPDPENKSKKAKKVDLAGLSIATKPVNAPAAPLALMDAPGASEDEDECRAATGLAGTEPLNPRYALTLLRVDVFGSVQSQIGQRLRDAKDLSDLIALSDAANYETHIATYGKLATMAQKVRLASLYVLVWNASADAYTLLREWVPEDQLVVEIAAIQGKLMAEQRNSAPGAHAHPRGANVAALFVPQRRITTIQNGMSVDDRHSEQDYLVRSRRVLDLVFAHLSDGLRSGAAIDGAIGSAMRKARAAYRAIEREGFRHQDESDPQFPPAFDAGAGSLAIVGGYLDRLLKALDAGRCWHDQFNEDLVVFHSQLAAMYNDGTLQPSDADSVTD